MYDTAKKAREAMKSKAKRLAGEKNEKVDSSDWSPAEPLNTDVKTGMRPVSRRTYKTGGKVMGEACAPRNDRKPRKSGGAAKAKKEMAEEKSEAAEYAKAKTNRDVKAANQEREGIKHIGGLKTGGRAKKQDGGRSTNPVPRGIRDRIGDFLKRFHPGDAAVQREQMRDVGKGQSNDLTPEDRAKMDRLVGETAMKKGGRTKRATGGATSLSGQKAIEQHQRDLSKPSRGKAQNYKKGGRAKGGPIAGAEEMMRSAAETSGVPSSTMSFTNVKKGMLSPLRGAKKGGRIDARDKKMGGGALMGGLLPAMAMGEMGGKDKEEGKKAGGRIARKSGGRADKDKLSHGRGKLGGGPISDPALMSGSSELYRRTAMRADGGRTAYKSGGRAKPSKAGTKINIMIAAGKPASPTDMMPPAGPMGGTPPGLPIPLPGDGGGAPPPMPMPMPMPAPAAGGTPPMGMPPGMPMPRKTGGRVTKIAKSYKDMEAGAGSGEGRLQKTDIAKTRKDAPKA